MSSHGKGRAKTPVVWGVNTAAANAWTGVTPRAIAAATLSNVALLATQSAISGAAVPLIGEVTVLRIVGDLIVRNTDTVLGYWAAGIIVTDDITGDATNLLNPAVAADADAHWLWLRHGHLLPASTPVGATNMWDSPEGCHLDVKVKRKMRPSQQLNLMFICSSSTEIVTNLRLLMSRPA